MIMKALPVILMLGAWAAQAQPNKSAPPPPKVDKALRQRITEFYQDYVDAKFRDAETMVAADSKNFFYSIEKPQYYGFEIGSIAYSDNFTHARVVTICKQQVLLPGFGDKPVPMPVTTTWKIEKGKWYWWVDQITPYDTPFGKMAAPSVGPAPSGSSGLPALPTTADFALKKVVADKRSLAIKPGESGEVTFANSAPGMMTVAVHGQPSGVTVTPASANVPAGGKVTFKIELGPEAQPTNLTFTVQPTGETIEVKITVPAH